MAPGTRTLEMSITVLVGVTLNPLNEQSFRCCEITPCAITVVLSVLYRRTGKDGFIAMGSG